MMEIEDTIVVRASPNDVFTIAGDPENMPLWNRAVLQSEVLGSLERGATVLQLAQVCGRRFEIAYLVTAYEPPRRAVFESISGPVDVEGTMTFRKKGAGTEMRWSIRGDCRGFLHVAERVLCLMGRKELRSCLGNLKHLVERAAAAQA